MFGAAIFSSKAKPSGLYLHPEFFALATDESRTAFLCIRNTGGPLHYDFRPLSLELWDVTSIARFEPLLDGWSLTRRVVAGALAIDSAGRSYIGYDASDASAQWLPVDGGGQTLEEMLVCFPKWRLVAQWGHDRPQILFTRN